MNKYKYFIYVSLLLVFLWLVGTIFFKKDVQPVAAIEIQEEQTKQNNIIKVDIKGAVNNPGVYELDSLTRVQDVIDLAGGLKKDADTSNINLSKIIKDEMVIIISTKTELKNQTINVEKTPVTNDVSLTRSEVIPKLEIKDDNNELSAIININNASMEELMTLNGIGVSKAQAIIDYRNTFGNFLNIEDIKNVTGIGESAYSKIKDNITV